MICQGWARNLLWIWTVAFKSFFFLIGLVGGEDLLWYSEVWIATLIRKELVIIQYFDEMGHLFMLGHTCFMVARGIPLFRYHLTVGSGKKKSKSERGLLCSVSFHTITSSRKFCALIHRKKVISFENWKISFPSHFLLRVSIISSQIPGNRALVSVLETV